MTTRDDAFRRLQKLAAGRFDDDVQLWLSGAAAMMIKLGGALNFHVCCGLPGTPKKMQMQQRDLYLHELASLLHPDAPRDTHHRFAEQLKSEVNQFISRGAWRHWKDRTTPPAEATPVQEKLFFVVRANGGRGLSKRSISQRLGGK